MCTRQLRLSGPDLPWQSHTGSRTAATLLCADPMNRVTTSGTVDDQIDRLVYELYGLSGEEIAIVGGS